MTKKKIPEVIETPVYQENVKEIPDVTITKIENPQITKAEKPNPPIGHTENCITVSGETIEIKATKLKYQRDKTAAFYKILQKIPLVEILSFKDGVIDPERSSDKVLFDWLIAVTDDPQFVSKHYDEFDSDVVEQMLKIFCRLNHIDEKEERKNVKAQMNP